MKDAPEWLLNLTHSLGFKARAAGAVWFVFPEVYRIYPDQPEEARKAFRWILRIMGYREA